MAILKSFVKSALFSLLGARIASADAVALAQACADTAAEAPVVCVGAIAACIAAWGLEAIIGNSPFNQRAAWIQDFVDNSAQNSPSLNVIAIATYYNNPFEHGSGVGQVNGDCGHTHQEIPMQGDWGTTQGVEIYTVGSDSNCCVEKWGDGGWTNWGYYGGWSQSTTASGSLMMCLNAAPPPSPPALQGVAKYAIDEANALLTVNGIVGRLLGEDEPLYSFNEKNSLYKWQNAESGPYFQATVQTDGNFVVFYFDAAGNRTPVFWSNTGGKVNDPNWQLIPQHDGNLVLYRSDTDGVLEQATWASQTGVDVGDGYVGLSLQQDGNLVLYALYPDGSCDPIWAANGIAPTGQVVWPH